MAKGAESKAIILDKILSIFEGAFIASDGKTIRIPMNEGGDAVEIKVALTAAKDLEGGGAASGSSAQVFESAATSVAASEAVSAPSEQEIAQVNALMEALNF